MRVLVTGALGNIGRNTVAALASLGHSTRAMAHRTRDARLEASWGRGVDVVVADLTAPATVERAVHGVDVVVHLAYVIPPACLEQPALARAVNVDGTRHLIEAMRAAAPRARLLFASSLDVFGRTAHLPPPRRVDDPVMASDAYTEHKLAGEAMVRDSGLTWAIFRLADVPPLVLRGPVPMMFEIPLAQRIETMHPLDAGLALARGATSEETWGKVWLIGGGPSCQLTYRDYLFRMMEAMELGGPLPEEAFSTTPYCTDWLDTADSQRAFAYQRHGFDDILADLAALLGWKRSLARLSRPVVREYMLSLSPYYRRRAASQA